MLIADRVKPLPKLTCPVLGLQAMNNFKFCKKQPSYHAASRAGIGKWWVCSRRTLPAC